MLAGDGDLFAQGFDVFISFSTLDLYSIHSLTGRKQLSGQHQLSLVLEVFLSPSTAANCRGSLCSHRLFPRLSGATSLVLLACTSFERNHTFIWKNNNPKKLSI